MGYGIRVKFDPIREIAFGSISGTYAPVGGVTTDFVRIISLNNGTNQDLYMSFNGVNDHLRLAPSSFKLFDLTANQIPRDGFFLAKNLQIYVKQVTAPPTAGALWIEIISGGGGT